MKQRHTALGRRPSQGYLEWGVTMGEEYLALGLTFAFDQEHTATGPYVHLLPQKVDGLTVRHYDLRLFTITDPRASHYWEAPTRQFAGGEIVDVLPPTLANEFYPHADAELDSQGEDDAWFAFPGWEMFKRLRDSLAAE